MEASFFRCLARELGAALCGRRIEKIHGPAEGVLVLTFSPQGPGSGKRTLIFRPAKSAGLLFASPERPANPAQAPARVMWLRKRAQGRRLLSFRADWPNLRLGFELSPRDVPSAGRWLVFDMREGLALPEDFHEAPEPAWPPLARILAEPDIWREFPQLTPPLRRRLAALAADGAGEAEGLLARLARGECSGFFLPPAANGADRPPLAWDEGLPGTEAFATAGEAATAHGLRTLFPQLAAAEQRQELDQAQAAHKRLRRRLKQLDDDEARHAGLAGLATAAEALQAALSGLAETPKTGRITLDHPAKGPVEVPLDPRLSPSENMALLFRQAAKGRRGLEHARRRRAEVREELEAAPAVPASALRGPDAEASGPALLPKRYQGLAVALFRTSDGFVCVRGKSQQANHDILSKAASPFDYWLHVAGGPSAHVILRRDHPDQEVPERSLMEAAVLCALKSYRRDDAKADVLLARVRDVRKVKGAAIGSVAVDEVERVLRVDLDPELEDRLAVGLAAQAPPKARPQTRRPQKRKGRG